MVLALPNAYIDHVYSIPIRLLPLLEYRSDLPRVDSELIVVFAKFSSWSLTQISLCTLAIHPGAHREVYSYITTEYNKFPEERTHD